MAFRNRFNNLSSKEWLPFQKSWFIFKDIETLYDENIRFFIKEDHEECAPVFAFYGHPDKFLVMKRVAEKNGFDIIDAKHCKVECDIQFALFDLRDDIKEIHQPDEADDFIKKIIPVIKEVSHKIIHRRFLSIFIANIYNKERTLPVAWDMSERISRFLSLKDEKIGCFETDEVASLKINYFKTQNNFFYCQYFRKDENSNSDYGLFKESEFYKNIDQENTDNFFKHLMSNWHIIRPKRRSKKEIQHPAKYPEEVVSLFLQYFTKPGDNVFDPMSGTASTQLAALSHGRNGYGSELSEFFTDIANERLANYVKPQQVSMFNEDRSHLDYKILNKDARKVKKADFPVIDYMITSPPYWDMLNMIGAENQAKRKEKGLQTNYSDNEFDLGNISDYKTFINSLIEVYKSILPILKPGGYFTIIVKNIKKKGKNYPFAYDLGHLLQQEMILLPEVFWVQNDINIAPYGYGNTFVSNTFHQYCLTFQKPNE